MPEIFMVNWFRKSSQGGFLWPGFGENIRVIDWCLRRCDGEVDIAKTSPIGHVPAEGSLCLDGLEEEVDLEAIFSTPKQFWMEEVEELKTYFSQQVGKSLPEEIMHQLKQLETRFSNTTE